MALNSKLLFSALQSYIGMKSLRLNGSRILDVKNSSIFGIISMY